MELLWTEKHKPTFFEDCDFHNELNDQLNNLIERSTFPHMILYGPGGGGKRTRINCILNKMYGRGALKTQKDTWRVKNNNKLIEINVKYSNYHAELTPSDVNFQDRIVLTKLIKESATNSTLFSNANKKNDFIVYVLYDVEKLTLEAQAALRRTLEKYSKKIRVIMVSERIGNIIPAVKSRCLLMRVPSPSDEKIRKVLEEISRKEKFDSDNILETIVKKSNGNLRKAILMLQSAFLTGVDKEENMIENWKLKIEDVVNKIFENQTALAVKELRKEFYSLLCNQIPGSEIVKEILYQVLVRLKTSRAITEAKKVAVDVDVNMNQGDKHIIHLESFAVKLMIIIKKDK